ncbi:uncharacterized protein LOC133336759 [Musca vetustissima]|uniref:uncharacterized protein LOC133336759 n=1 Tax=Musca vetustissima TaxID=27455 RepID=UPI002AB61FAC|nr:uncharacterized protein LOC133336759 [Musca vetustissima]
MFITKAVIIFTLFYTTVLCGEMKNWTYELVSIEATTTDPDIADIAVKEKRIGRGLYAFSGFLDFKTDLDDSTVVDVRVYRSSTEREQDYQLTPFVIDNETLTNFINFHYKAYIMPSIKECAPDAPQFEGDDEFEPPFSKMRIDVNDCDVPVDGFPNLLEYGLYKIEAYARNDIEMFLKVVVRVERP